MSESQSEDFVLKCLLLVISSISLLVNFLLACFLLRNNKHILKRKSNKFLFNMVLSDTCVSIATVCFAASIISDKRLSTDAMFHTQQQHWLILIAAFAPISISNLMLLTIDRVIAVTKPFFYTDKFLNKYVYYFISISWLFAVLDILTFELLATYVEVFHELFYTILHSCLVCFISLGLITLTLSNFFIFVEARRQLHKINALSANQLNHKTLGHAKECRLIRITIGLVMVFLICWIPCFVLSLRFLLTQNLNFRFLMSVWIIAVVNYLLNPFIYLCLSHDAKTEFRITFFRLKTFVSSSSLNNGGSISISERYQT
nr:D(1)-like dopamine receptor [Hydra vulgaris]